MPEQQTQIPQSLVLTESAYWLDGGTNIIFAVSENGVKCRIQLNQRLIDFYAHPGRLHLNGNIVEVRSQQESQILRLLRNARTELPENQSAEEDGLSENAIMLSDDIKDVLDRSPKANLLRFRDEIVAFVESEEYVAIAKNGIPPRPTGAYPCTRSR